jgi:proteasome lid subunit RPN8/RPN11
MSGRNPDPKCQKIVMSDRALSQIYNETSSKGDDETGGLLLGHFIDGIWYIVESSDPGYNAIFQRSYHESDERYVNHVCDIISRTYKYPLNFLGMWHRHPGSLDTFSGTDDVTNAKYAESAGNGCISLLINKDPNFRMTAYYVDISSGSASYVKTDMLVGDNHITKKEVMEVASQRDIDRR